ncbi:MAG: FAD-dependent oxidoreductase, partial [bacterium]|nr:FAD-dependent oxidoreductase [bacterium]
MSSSKAIIIGAGVAGLASALRLGEGERFSSLLLERETQPGGLARSFHFMGVTTDFGPHRIHTELPEVDQLINRVAAPSLITVQRRSHIYLGGRFLRYPPSPLDMVRRLGPLRMARFAASYATGRLCRAPARETYETLMCRAFGRSLYEYLLRPYSTKTWKIDPAQLHADTARVRVSAGSLTRLISRLWQREARGHETSLAQFRYVKGGIQTLVRHLEEHALAAGARLELNREVQRLEMDAAGNRVLSAIVAPPVSERTATLADQAAAAGCPGRLEADVFLSTAPLPLLVERMLPPVAALADAREAAAGLQFLNLLFVCLIVRRAVVSGDNWLYFPDPALIFNRAYEAKSFDPSLAPGDRSVICVEITYRPGDPIGHATDGEIVKTVTGQLASTGLITAGEVEDSAVIVLPFAYPLYTL